MPISNTTPGLNVPCANCDAVTPADGSNLARAARALYIGSGGAIALVTVGGDTVTFSGLLGGTILPVRTARVKSTGTTATSIIALI